MTSKYFKSSEAKETLSNNIYIENTPIVDRTHVYKSSAVYIGQWKGGMRHGKGAMKWPPNNAFYVGEW